MEKATKNTHLNHLEDNIFLNGIEGTRDSINFIQGLRDTLQGNNSRAMNTSVKWDGAPAIWIGPHPTNGHLMVAKKSLFNKVPLYYQSVADIKNSTDSARPLTYFEAIFFQFVNPKSIIVGLTSISLFIDTQNNYLRDSIVLTVLWFLMAVGSQTGWCLMGKYMRKFATSDKFIKNFNYTMSFLLIVCVILFYV